MSLLQGVYMSLSDEDSLTGICQAAVPIVQEHMLASECAQCEGLDASACVALLNDQLAALSDKSRLSYLRSNVPNADLTCDGLTQKACLVQLEIYMEVASD